MTFETSTSKCFNLVSCLECCGYLLHDLQNFLDLYNLHFIRAGSYIDDMYKLSIKGLNAYYETKPEDLNDFYNKYKIFWEFKYKQYVEFKEIDNNGKVRK